MSSLLTRLKSKWGIQSNWDFFLINLTFALAGMIIGFERRPIFHLLGISKQTPFFIKALVYIPLIPPVYQCNLLIFGSLLGQFNFFWEKEKRLGKILLKVFTKKF